MVVSRGGLGAVDVEQQPAPVKDALRFVEETDVADTDMMIQCAVVTALEGAYPDIGVHVLTKEVGTHLLEELSRGSFPEGIDGFFLFLIVERLEGYSENRGARGLDGRRKRVLGKPVLFHQEIRHRVLSHAFFSTDPNQHFVLFLYFSGIQQFFIFFLSKPECK
jgi:hypothetical protein